MARLHEGQDVDTTALLRAVETGAARAATRRGDRSPGWGGYYWEGVIRTRMGAILWRCGGQHATRDRASRRFGKPALLCAADKLAELTGGLRVAS